MEDYHKKIQNIDIQENYLYDLLDDIDCENNKEEDKDICINCNSARLVKDEHEGLMICKDCGVINDNIMDSADDPYSDKNGQCSSIPINSFLPKSSISTKIEGMSRNNIRRLHGWNAMPYKERSLYNVLKDIQNKCNKNNILKCIEDDAKILYKNISECKHKDGKNKDNYIIIRGTNRESLIAACLYYACKRKGQTRSQKEIANIFNLKEKDITKGCKKFIEIIGKCNIQCDFDSSKPKHFVFRYCKELGIKKFYEDETLKIVKNIDRLGIATIHTPLSIATGSILLMCSIYNLNITRKKIAKQFSVSEVTINKAYKELEKYSKIITNDYLTTEFIKYVNKIKNKELMPIDFKKRVNNRLGNIQYKSYEY